jgi:hypothetical protein
MEGINRIGAKSRQGEAAMRTMRWAGVKCSVWSPVSGENEKKNEWPRLGCVVTSGGTQSEKKQPCTEWLF